MAGATSSADFVTTPGSFMQSLRGGTSAFIIKLAAEDYSLIASTLLGGDTFDGALSIAISRNGKVVVGGITSSSDFPVSSSAFQPIFGGGQNDGFLAVLDNNLQALEYGTYIGGPGFDAFFASVAAENRIHIGGVTSSTDLPSSPGALQPGFAGVTDTYFLTFNLSTNSVEFSPALKAIDNGFGAYFVRAYDLMEDLRKARNEHNLDRRMKVYLAPKVLVVDEFGIWPYDRESATAFFTLVSARYERGSIILTSNKGFGEWGELLGDTVIASAVLDRLLHHSHVLNIRGESYRLREKRQSGIFSSHRLLGATPANGNDNYPD